MVHVSRVKVIRARQSTRGRLVVSRGKMWRAYKQAANAAENQDRVEHESHLAFEMSHLFGNKTLEAVKPVRWPSSAARWRRGVANQVCLFAGVAREVPYHWEFERDWLRACGARFAWQLQSHHVIGGAAVVVPGQRQGGDNSEVVLY